jgi:hypothetical protein
MSDFDTDYSDEYKEHLLARMRRLKARAAREASLLDSVSDDSSPDEVKGVQGEASATESSGNTEPMPHGGPSATGAVNDGMISEAEVPPGTQVFENPNDAVAALDASEAGTDRPSLAAFARARLTALLLDDSVKDPQLVSAAKALLRDHPQRRDNTATGERTVFLIPDNGGGPPPYGKVFYIRARATPNTAPAADTND